MQKIMDRVYNVEKNRKQKRSGDQDGESPRKRGRPKKKETLESRYPIVQGDYEPPDRVTDERNNQAIKKMSKDKPRKEVILPLMKTTFYRPTVVRGQHGHFCGFNSSGISSFENAFNGEL